MTAFSGISDLSPFKKRSSGTRELEALLDLLPHPTLIVNGRSAKVLMANTRAIELTAYTRQEFSELQLSTLLPEINRSTLRQVLKADSFPLEYELVNRSSKSTQIALTADELGGSEHWVALILQPAAALAQDKAARRREDERWEAMQLLALAPQQKELSSCFRQILQAGNLLTGAEDLALYADRGEEAGLQLEAVWGSTFNWPSQLDDRELAHLRTPKVWQPGKSIDATLHKLAHGQQFSFLATTPLDLTQPSSGIVVATDPRLNPPAELINLLQILAASAVTAKLNTELTSKLSSELDLLASSAQLSQRLQEGVQDGIIFVDKTLDVKQMNRAAASMFGYSPQEALGRQANDILISTHPVLNNLHSALKNGQSQELGEITLHRRDGSEFLAQVRVQPILDEEQVQQLVILLTDLSDQHALHLQSQQLQQRAWLGEVTAIFAHEVRNPINNISTGLQLMQISFDEDDPMQEQIKRLQEDCDRLEHRMKSVLSFSRSLDHNPSPIDIGQFCRMQLERWRPRMARKNIEDHIQVDEKTPMLYGDQRALDQVFTNLITNSIQAMDSQGGGVLAIKAKPSNDEGFIDIQVSDTGPGIPEDLVKRIFDPFFSTKGDEGTGLGLAITRRIIMAHKGEIDLDTFPGGTIFKIKLPTVPTAPLEEESA